MTTKKRTPRPHGAVLYFDRLPPELVRLAKARARAERRTMRAVVERLLELWLAGAVSLDEPGHPDETGQDEAGQRDAPASLAVKTVWADETGQRRYGDV